MPRSVVQCVALVLLIAIATTGCSTVQENPKTAIGGLGGAAFGGLIAAAAGGGGPAIAGAVIGGALLGGLVGNMLDQRDKRMQAEAAQKAMESTPSGKPVAWNKPDSGHPGTGTPVRTYQSNGQYCREYQTTVTIDNKQEKGYGTACRQPDGSWKIES